MIRHPNDFEPFVEDDVPFGKHVNVVIHQLNNPLWHIRGSDKSGARELHIAYRYGEHYDSVRRINDNAETPANLQTETLSKDESNRKGKQKSSSSDERRGDAVQKVRNATGCADVRLILQSLEAESFDVESTIQVILQIEELKQIGPMSRDGLGSNWPEPPRHRRPPT